MRVENRSKKSDDQSTWWLYDPLEWLVFLAIAVPASVIAGAIAGIGAYNVVPRARVWQVVARAAALSVVGMVVAFMIGICEWSGGFMVAIATAGVVAVLFGNVAEYVNLRHRNAEQSDAAESR